MATSYAEAVAILEAIAVRSHTRSKLLLSEEIPLTQAVGRITAREYVSPLATPAFDSSAMDGFAVVSNVTRRASQDNPVVLKVQACTLAGHPAVQTTSSLGHDELEPCIEIMTGARFPIVEHDEKEFDAVIKTEDVIKFDLITEHGSVRCIKVTKPVAKSTHKRFAGSDFQKEESILRIHETVRPHHIMAMASVGFTTIQVRRKVRIGLWSTGRELAPCMQDSCRDFQIMDANGPYLEAALREMGAEVDFLGVLDDDELAFRKVLRRQAHSKLYDILITTGAVSKGKLDFVPSGLKSLGAIVRFHGVAMRPGHPVVFATLPLSSSAISSSEQDSQSQVNDSIKHAPTNEIAFFGLPGNPVATAACLKFLVTPYLHTLTGMRRTAAIRATVVNTGRSNQLPEHVSSIKSEKRGSRLDHFKHGFLSADASATGWTFQMSTDQSPAKLRPFSAANCWGHIRSDEIDIEANAIVDCFPF